MINYHKSKAGAEEVLEQIEPRGPGIIVGADVSSSAKTSTLLRLPSIAWENRGFGKQCRGQ